MLVADGTRLTIADTGTPVTLDYAGALAAHRGESWFGVAVSFRMLQAAGDALSTTRPWDRNELFIVSGHPGAGVRDAIDHVTHCVSRGRFRLDADQDTRGCSRGMRFAWEIADGRQLAAVTLREDFVPEALFTLLDRRGTPDERPGDARAFAALKRGLAERVWEQPLASLFRVAMLEGGLAGHA